MGFSLFGFYIIIGDCFACLPTCDVRNDFYTLVLYTNIIIIIIVEMSLKRMFRYNNMKKYIECCYEI